jgi:hypothetical protein
MGQYNSAVLTTAGQSLLTSILGAEGTLTFSKFQTSSYQYASGTDLSALTSLQNVEQEVIPSAGGVKDATTFYSSSTVSNEGVTVEYDCYTVGLFATDGENEVLFAVATAITPDVISVDDGGTPSTYTYTMSIGVSSTDNITVEVDDQGILRVTSIVDNLTSTSTTQPLSAKQGKVLSDLIDDNTGAIEAIVNVYGSKQLLPYPYVNTTKTENGITFTDNGDGAVILSGSNTSGYPAIFYLATPYVLKKGDYILSGCPSGGSATSYMIFTYGADVGRDIGDGLEIHCTTDTTINIAIGVISGTTFDSPVTFYPQIRDARIKDPTWAPWAMTNRQLTENVTELNSNMTSYFISKTSSGTQLWIDFATELRIQVIQKHGVKTTSLSGVFEQAGVTNWKFTGVYSGYFLYVLSFLESGAIRVIYQYGDNTTKIWDIPSGTPITT